MTVILFDYIHLCMNLFLPNSHGFHQVAITRMPKQHRNCNGFNKKQTIRGLIKNASAFFKANQLKLAVDCYHALFEADPKYLRQCGTDYSHAIEAYLHELTHPYADTKMIEHDDGIIKEAHCIRKRVNLRKDDPSKYKFIAKYHRARIKFTKKSIRYGLPESSQHILRAYAQYVTFLRCFEADFRIQFKYMCKIQIYTGGNKLNYLNCYIQLIRTGNFDLAHKFRVFHYRKFTPTTDDVADTFDALLHCYMLQQMHQHEKCLKLWKKVEGKFEYHTIDRMLFPQNEDRYRSIIFPCGVRAARSFLPNTTILDMKLECFIGLEQYDKARDLCNFFYDFWGRDEQTVFYDGYLDLRMQNIEAAKTKLSIIPVSGWKQNQHYFAGLLYFYLGEYEHAKYHFFCTRFGQEYALHIYDHLHWLCLTLIECKEWKLCKYFMKKAKPLKYSYLNF